ncbi:MAG: DinB family protein [Anaerolineae bacterium]|nr:DinB family protein [Anaerolineae bacterium]
MEIYSQHEIITALNERYERLINWLENHDDELFEKGPDGKWTTGEHVQHLILSTKPLNQGLRMPRLVLRTTFGKNNRAERTFEETVERYKIKLSEGGTATSRFVPKPISKTEKPKLIAELKSENEALATIINKWETDDLNIYLLPHPLLGKLTLREMLFFTIYHTEHHFTALRLNY